MIDPLYKNSIFQYGKHINIGGIRVCLLDNSSRTYKTENVGIATTLISIMTLLSSFTIIGLNSSLTRYLPKSANKNELINSSFVIVTLVTILASIIFFLGLQIFLTAIIISTIKFRSILSHSLSL